MVLIKRIALLLILTADSSAAIDLGRAFGKATKDGATKGGGPSDVSTEDAVKNAKQLIDDMNDASTGTIILHKPGKEKEPTTCNDIMAKA
jgi:hypothetical protein